MTHLNTIIWLLPICRWSFFWPLLAHWRQQAEKLQAATGASTLWESRVQDKSFCQERAAGGRRRGEWRGNSPQGETVQTFPKFLHPAPVGRCFIKIKTKHRCRRKRLISSALETDLLNHFIFCFICLYLILKIEQEMYQFTSLVIADFHSNKHSYRRTIVLEYLLL